MFGVRCVLIENPAGDDAEGFSMELRGEPSITGEMKRRKVKKNSVYAPAVNGFDTVYEVHVFSFSLMTTDTAASHSKASKSRMSTHGIMC